MRIGNLASAVTARPLLSNYAILLLIACVFNVQMMLDPNAEYLGGMVLEKWSVCALFGHMWLHMTVAHVAGNLGLRLLCMPEAGPPGLRGRLHPGGRRGGDGAYGV